MWIKSLKDQICKKHISKYSSVLVITYTRSRQGFIGTLFISQRLYLKKIINSVNLSFVIDIYGNIISVDKLRDSIEDFKVPLVRN